MFQRVMGALVIASSLAVSLHAQSVAHPSSITPEGGASLPLAGAATRTHLLGLTDLYSLALYIAGSTSREHLLSPDVPKVLRFQIIYE